MGYWQGVSFADRQLRNRGNDNRMVELLSNDSVRLVVVGLRFGTPMPKHAPVVAQGLLRDGGLLVVRVELFGESGHVSTPLVKEVWYCCDPLR